LVSRIVDSTKRSKEPARVLTWLMAQVAMEPLPRVSEVVMAQAVLTARRDCYC
jgi:hypothetical protein